jgi:GMP synthase (glutamine-hydrolysing)
MSRRLLVLLAGDPVPSAEQRFGSFADMFRYAAADSYDGAWLTLDLRQEPELPRASELAGVLVSGSAAYLAEALPWMNRAVGYLSELRALDVPTLGICFGHQLLGLATGGQVARNPSGREIGTVDLAVTNDNPLMGRTETVKVNASHLDSVVQLGDETTRTGHTRLEQNAIVHFGARSWGVQFHPEFNREIVSCYLRERSDTLEQEGLDPQALLSAAEDCPEAMRVIPNFLHRVVLGV